MKLARLAVIVLFASLACAPALLAGPYGDDMAKCLVKSASPQDRTLLVRWVFSVLALHPDLASMSTITPQQRDAMNKASGALFERLLFDACKTETQQAILNEGLQTMEYAFNVLGQVATRNMFTNAQVQDGMKGFTKYIDQEKLKALAAPHAAP